MMYTPEAIVSVVEATVLKFVSFIGYCEEKSTVKKNEPSLIYAS